MSALEDIATALGTVRDRLGELDTATAATEISNASEKAADLGHEGLLTALAAAKDGTEKLQAMLAEARQLAEDLVTSVEGMAGG